MKLISTDTEKCVHCNKCAVVCPMGVIEMSSEGFPQPIRNAFELCINCGYCVDICEFDALFHKVRKRTSDSSAAMKRYEAAIRKKQVSVINEK